MAGVKKGFAVGAISAFIYRINSSDIATGSQDPDNLTNGSTYHAYKLGGVTSITLPQVTYETAVDRGDQKIYGQVDLGASDFGQFEIGLSQEDADLRALIGDSTVDQTTLSNAVISSPNTGLAAPPTVGVMFTTYYQSRDSGSVGTLRYRTYIFPKVQVRYNAASASQDGGTNPNPVTLTCTPSEGSAFPGGNAFSSTQGWANNQTLFYDIVADNPFALSVLVGDGVETTYTLAYLPSSTETGATDHILTENGSVTAPSSINTSTAVVTLSGALTSGQIAVAVYQTASTFQTP